MEVLSSNDRPIDVPTDPAAGLAVTVAHNIDTSEPDADGLFEFSYNFFDYRFDFGARELRARAYRDDLSSVSIIALVEGVDPVGFDVLLTSPELQAAAAYFRHRDFATIQVLGPNGYQPIPDALTAEAAR